MIAFENTQDQTAMGEAQLPDAMTPTTVALFGNDYRMASWGFRFDIATTDPDDPKYVESWKKAMKSLRNDAAGPAFTAAISNLFSGAEAGTANAVYVEWQKETIPILQAAPIEDFQRILEERLDNLVARMSAEPAFRSRISGVHRAFSNYATTRDELLRDIQSHRASMEYTNQHPINSPSTSNVRFIYSHQPSTTPVLLTLNAGFTWYNMLAGMSATGRFRDVQVAGQLDRRLGDIPRMGNAVMTLAGYYQWMKEDAVILIGPGNIAPGSGITLPGTAAQLLGTKGSIGVVQGKLTIPMNGALKVPISVTWSNRRELINESELRGQVGITVDLDSVFK